MLSDCLGKKMQFYIRKTDILPKFLERKTHPEGAEACRESIIPMIPSQWHDFQDAADNTLTSTLSTRNYSPCKMALKANCFRGFVDFLLVFNHLVLCHFTDSMYFSQFLLFMTFVPMLSAFCLCSMKNFMLSRPSSTAVYVV